MGNCINVLDKDGNILGQATHGLTCCFYASDIVEQYNPNFNIHSLKDINEQLNPAYDNGSPEDVLILRLFFNDDSVFDETDLPYFDKAIAKLKSGNRIHENIKKHLNAYKKVLQENKFIRMVYMGVFSSIAVSKGV